MRIRNLWALYQFVSNNLTLNISIAQAKTKL